jgi:peptidoglycan/xylan/chitin deacetylase (PgdA/CDA1 family)
VARGFEVGAHTVNHADLGACTVQEAEYEVRESGRTLQAIVGEPIRWFSFPFGAIHNIRQDTAEVVMQSGYSAMFSAHGGFVKKETPLSDIPRIGCNGRTRPLYLLLEMEGLAPNQLKTAIFRPFGR